MSMLMLSGRVTLAKLQGSPESQIPQQLSSFQGKIRTTASCQEDGGRPVRSFVHGPSAWNHRREKLEILTRVWELGSPTWRWKWKWGCLSSIQVSPLPLPFSSQPSSFGGKFHSSLGEVLEGVIPNSPEWSDSLTAEWAEWMAVPRPQPELGRGHSRAKVLAHLSLTCGPVVSLRFLPPTDAGLPLIGPTPGAACHNSCPQCTTIPRSPCPLQLLGSSWELSVPRGKGCHPVNAGCSGWIRE